MLCCIFLSLWVCLQYCLHQSSRIALENLKRLNLCLFALTHMRATLSNLAPLCIKGVIHIVLKMLDSDFSSFYHFKI